MFSQNAYHLFSELVQLIKNYFGGTHTGKDNSSAQHERKRWFQFGAGQSWLNYYMIL